MKKNSKKNILIVSTSFPRWKGDFDGFFVLELARRLTKYFNVFVLAPHCPKAKTREKWNNLSVCRFKYFWPSSLEGICYGPGILPNMKDNRFLILILPFLFIFQFLAIFRLVRKEKIDLINAHWILPAGLTGLLVSKILKKPLILSTHGPDIYSLLMDSFLRPFSKMIIKGVSHLTATSTITAGLMAKIAEIDLKKISVISMGVDSKLFKPSLELKEHLEKPIILFVGVLTKHKGVDYLIKSMSEIVKVFSKASLLIVGQGIEESNLKKMTVDLHLEKNINFIGGIENSELPYYYNQADVFVLASLREGLPVVLMEAMSSGCPIVATNIAGNPDMIKNGQNGFLIRTKSPEAIANAVLKILSDCNLRDRFIKEARLTIEKKYDWDIITSRFKEVFNNFITI